MYQPIQLNTAISPARSLIRRSPLPRGFLLFALICLGLSPAAQTKPPPPPDGDQGNGNTAEGTGALFSLTTGTDNTATGYETLFRLTTASFNTATGYQALSNDTTGYANTATGVLGLQANTTGAANSANGSQALNSNTVGNENTADGNVALFNNTTGNQNTATGTSALYSNTVGLQNTANGTQALYYNTGNFNTATGFEALYLNNIGSYNIALGYSAGINLTTGSFNIDIGNQGVADEAGTIRIGTAGNQAATFVAGISGTTVAGGIAVVVDANGQLGTIVSSQRFKDEIKSMDKASESILALRPVTFRYKHELDAKGIAQFGLIAEEVEKVNPDLVARDNNGKVFTVRYEAVNAMLLNEFLKQHRKAQEQETTITQLRSTVVEQQKSFQSTFAQQQQEIKVLTASMKEQASQIQKVSAQLAADKPATRVVDNNH
jgi:Chaperone of endosialidase